MKYFMIRDYADALTLRRKSLYVNKYQNGNYAPEPYISK
jgi:hypothetical protein